jgi:hypothetical protein
MKARESYDATSSGHNPTPNPDRTGSGTEQTLGRFRQLFFQFRVVGRGGES